MKKIKPNFKTLGPRYGKLMKEIAVVVAARNHRPFNPESEQHKKFLHTNLQKLRHIKNANPYVNFDEEESYFLREV
mgnify:CR=1 FL=1